MANNSITLTIFVNADENRIHLYSGGETSANRYVVASYRSTNINDEFFEEFSNLLSVYHKKFPQVSLSNVSLVLSDYLFLTDMVTIPNMGKRSVENSLNLVIGTLYNNKEDFEYNTFPLTQTKQNAVYGFVGLRKDLIEKFHEACKKCGGTIQNITFAANAVANSAMALNPKIKTASCLLLDIKENTARFAFLNKGRTIGAYNLPFGYSMLSMSELAAEDMLFDHSSAELLILNAHEKARSKKLSTNLEDADANVYEDFTTQILGYDAEEEEEEETVVRGKRELPKFMLRETPTDSHGFIYENFRIFVKWTLNLIASNPKFTSLDEIDTVYVNLPREYHFLFDMVNQEEEENGITFAPMVTDRNVPKILEMSGGFYVNQYNNINNF